MTEAARSMPASGLSGLRITGPRNLGGEIIITAGRTDAIDLDVARVLEAGSMEAAIVFAKEIAIRLEPVAGFLRLDIDTPVDAPWEGTAWSARCDLTITIPEDWDLDIDAHHYDLDLEGPFRSASVRTEYGQVKLSDVLERTEVSGSHTAVVLKGLRGEVSASTSYSDLVAVDIIASAEEAATFGNEFGKVVIQELVGAVVVNMDYAPVVVDDAVLLGSSSRIFAKDAPVTFVVAELSDAQLEIQVDNSDAYVTLPEDVSARLNLSVGRGGIIRTRDLEVRTRSNLLSPGRLEGTCGDGEGVVDVEILGAGTIEVRGG
jgi:hypothetical protein